MRFLWPFSRFQARLTALTEAVSGLAGVDPQANPDPTDNSTCQGAVGGQGQAAVGSAPRVAATGSDMDIQACRGKITLHSQECSFDPCRIKEELRYVQEALDALP